MLGFQRKSVPILNSCMWEAKMTVPTTNDHAHPLHPIKIKKCPVFNENRRLDHIRYDDSENDSPDGQRQRGGGQNVATVAKDEKIRFPTTVYAKNRFTLKIGF